VLAAPVEVRLGGGAPDRHHLRRNPRRPPFPVRFGRPGRHGNYGGPSLQEPVTSLLSSADQLRDKLMIVPSFEVRRSQIHTISQARKQFNATLAITGSAQ